MKIHYGIRFGRHSFLFGIMLFLGLLLSTSVKAVPYALARNQSVQVPPIKIPEDDGKLTRDLLVRQTKWLEDKLQEKFARRHQNAPWLADSLVFIHEVAPFLCFNATKNSVTGITTRPSAELLKQGRKLIADGCDDPIFCYLVAWIESFMSTPTTQSVQLFSSRWRSLLGTSDPAVFKAMATSWLWFACAAENKATSNQDIQAGCEAELPGLIVAALEEMSDNEDSTGVYLALYASRAKTFISSKFPFIVAGLEGCKGAPWLIDTLLGESEIDEAWVFRGNGWGASVTAEGWKGFEEHLAKARERLARSWVAKPDAPWAAAGMITVTLAGHGLAGVDERAWFDRATVAVFDYEPAYTALLSAYRPRWGGSHTLMLEFGKACADTKRYDTIVPSRLFKAVSSVVEDLDCRMDVYKDEELCGRIVELQKAMLARTDGEAEKHYFRSFLVTNAFLTGDYETAAAAYIELGGKPMYVEAVDRLHYFGIRPIIWMGTLALYADRDTFKIFKKAEEAYLSFDLDVAQNLYQELQKTAITQSSKAVSQLIQMRLLSIAVEKRIATGEWVHLSNEEGRLLWMATQNTWWTEPNGVLVLKNSRENVSARIILNARIGLDFEVRGRLSNASGLHHSQFGITFGYRWSYQGFATAIGGVTRFNPMENGVALVSWAHDTSDKNPPVPIEIKPDSVFCLRVKNGVATLWVDDKELLSGDTKSLFESRDPWSEDDPKQNLIGLGCNYFPKGETRFKDLQLRRL